MEIPHAQVIKEAIITRKIDNNEKNSVDKINIYKKKLENASEQYYQNIIQAVKNSIDYMQKKGNNDYIRLNNDDIQKSIQWDDHKKICWHWMHYGFIRKNWRSRDVSAWNKFDIKRPFIRAQEELKEKGWYLVDLSNPGRSFGVYIYLYTYPPDKIDLWHNLN